MVARATFLSFPLLPFIDALLFCQVTFKKMQPEYSTLIQFGRNPRK
jgi:hypothetical protein